jgi:hypothetical protein
MMSMDLFHEIPDYPENMSGTSVLVRLLDGLGFRFRWSTEGLSHENYQFRPAPDCMSVEELVKHVWGLVNWVCQSMRLNKFGKQDDISLVRRSVLEMIHALREALLSMSDEELAAIQIRELPFWHIVNGPLADALTHIGQINSFRRLAGNPTPKANVFRGLPPRD